METVDFGIEEMELGVRAYNILKRHDVNTLGDLLKVSAHDANEWAKVGHTLGLPAAKQIAEAQAEIRDMLRPTW